MQGGAKASFTRGGPFQRDFRKSMFHDGRLYAQWMERLEEFDIDVRTVCLSISPCLLFCQPVCLHNHLFILLMESLTSLIPPHMHTHTPHAPHIPHTLPTLLTLHTHPTPHSTHTHNSTHSTLHTFTLHIHSLHTLYTHHHIPHTLPTLLTLTLHTHPPTHSTHIPYHTPHTPITPHTPHSTHSTHSHSTSTHSTHFTHTPSHSTHHTLHTTTLHTHALIQESEENNVIPEFEGDTSQSQRSRTPSPLPEGKEKAKEKGGRDNGTVKIHLLCSLITHGSIHECAIVHLHISLDPAHCQAHEYCILPT